MLKTMSVYIAIYSKQETISLIGLTLYYTIQSFNDPYKEGFLKTKLKEEKMLVVSIFFLTLFSISSKTNCSI